MDQVSVKIKQCLECWSKPGETQVWIPTQPWEIIGWLPPSWYFLHKYDSHFIEKIKGRLWGGRALVGMQQDSKKIGTEIPNAWHKILITWIECVKHIWLIKSYKEALFLLNTLMCYLILVLARTGKCSTWDGRETLGLSRMKFPLGLRIWKGVDEWNF